MIVKLSDLPDKITKYVRTNPVLIVAGLLIINFVIRIFIYYNTRLFYFSDYSAYLNGIENIAEGERQFLLTGNFMFAISYIGYFAKYILGSLDFFFVFNCLLGTLTSLVLYYLFVKVTGSSLTGIITVVIHTFYTEFMVFSSVFYTPVIMIFLLSLFILLFWFYVTTKNQIILISTGGGLIFIFLLTFFFKPELKYLPWFFLIIGLCFIRKDISFSKKILTLFFLLLSSFYLFDNSGIISHPKGNVISNAFVFFGHTDYGGDGGEGSFVYPENKIRYEASLAEYCKVKNISNLTAGDYNTFRKYEIRKFITQHPLKWIGLQFTKFFRTFGVVPETTSFKVLYSGLFKGNLWLTSIVVVAPVALIIILFILFFNYSAILQLIKGSTLDSQLSDLNAPRSTLNTQHDSDKTGFLIIYMLFCIYYIIATIFYGQYQERYRLTLMVVFIIPSVSYFITGFDRRNIFKRISLIIRSALIALFLSVWVFQTKKAVSNKVRFNKAMELVEQARG